MQENMKNEGCGPIYLYCIAHSDRLPCVEEIGDDKNRVFLHTFLDIAAVVSTASLEDFCGPSAESRLRDLSWLGPRVCRHEEVVEHVMRRTPVLPARFGTVFSSPLRLERLLQTHYRTIAQFLEQVDDKEEWAVKGFLDRERAKQALFCTLRDRESGQSASLSPGKKYFKEKQAMANTEKKLKGWLKEVCQDIGNDLNRYVSSFCERKILSRGTTGTDMDMLLNWAFLVPKGSAADFQARVEWAKEKYEKQGLHFELSGPWPPYSFRPSLE